MGSELIKANKCFDGIVKQFRHSSDALSCEMKFSVFFPAQSEHEAVPVVIYLSGLTCTDENFMTKAGAQQYASQYGIALVAPDTSPRGLGIPGEDESYDFGTGAGFYINAVQDQWKQYRMEDYVMKDLFSTLSQFSELDCSRVSIMGHSMGGHGALVLSLRHPGIFVSTSAFAPICNPSQVPWGQKAFGGYLGPDVEKWKNHDASELVKNYAGRAFDVLMDTGTDDEFLDSQLKPWVLEQACSGTPVRLTSNMRQGYDHSYYFISTFVKDHIAFHAERLNAK